MAYVVDRVYEECGIDTLFTPLHYPEDKHFIDSIRAGMVHKDHGHVLTENYSVEEMEALSVCAMLPVTMRLHALIYAVTSKTPVVGVILRPEGKISAGCSRHSIGYSGGGNG